MRSPDTAGVIAPPPLIFAACLAAGMALEWLLPGSLLPAATPRWLRWTVGICLAVGGGVLALMAERAFRAVGTDARPWRPTTALALAGPYRFTRNPMYLGLVLLLAGIAIGASSLWVAITLPVLVVVLRFGVMAREERYLEGKFGDDYRSYRGRVRRWL